jgi:hypothetical protein
MNVKFNNNMKSVEGELKKGIVMILKNAKPVNFLEKKCFLIEDFNQIKVIC